MNWKLFGLVFVAAAALFLIPNQVEFVSAAENQTTSNVTVTGIVDVTINCSSINWTALAPNTVNNSADNCFPLNITIYANTNTQTQIYVNGSDLSGPVTYEVENITYTNGTTGPAPHEWRMSLNETATSGLDADGGPFDDWVAIGDPGVDTHRYAYWYMTAPATIPKGTYAGTVFVTISDTG